MCCKHWMKRLNSKWLRKLISFKSVSKRERTYWCKLVRKSRRLSKLSRGSMGSRTKFLMMCLNSSVRTTIQVARKLNLSSWLKSSSRKKSRSGDKLSRLGTRTRWGVKMRFSNLTERKLDFIFKIMQRIFNSYYNQRQFKRIFGIAYNYGQ